MVFGLSKFMGIFLTIVTVASFAHWKCSLIGMWQWCSCLCTVQKRWSRRSLTSFRGRTRFQLFLMLPLSFKNNYDGITSVLKQSANCAIILAKILCFCPTSYKRFPILEDSIRPC